VRHSYFTFEIIFIELLFYEKYQNRERTSSSNVFLFSNNGTNSNHSTTFYRLSFVQFR